MALAYGEDLPDITDNKITVQQIYDENYNFARPPDKPTMWAVPGDGKVTLYWDDIAEASFDPVTGMDFEGYKIYRATDPGFNEVFTVTDGLGRKTFHQPIAQFDLNNGNAGFFPVIRNSVIYYLGQDTGLEHTWADTTVENGQTYYYAVVAYDRGDVEKAILPAENSKTIVVDASGNVTLDINTATVVPRAPASGYEPPQFSTLRHMSGYSTGNIAIEVVDARLVTNNMTYSFTFDQVTDTSDITYSVTRAAPESTTVIIENVPLIPVANLLPQASRFGAYYDSLFNLYPGTYDPTLYFRVAGTELYDGQRAYMLIPRQVALIQENSGWADTSKGLYEFRFGLTNYSQYFLLGEAIPGDFAIEWYDGVVDTSADFNWFNLFVLPPTPVNFRVKDTNTNEYIDFAFDEQPTTMNGVVDNAEVIIFLQDVLDSSTVTWAAEFRSRTATGDTVQPSVGDELLLRLYQPYSSADEYEYDTRSARVNRTAVELERINVYPNPYVAATNQEPTNPFNEGRGERRITFNHLPDKCTIRIYTVRGDLVETIVHDAGIDDGTENWDLRTKDGLNAAYGVYLYHVESPYGEKTGRFAVIK